MDKRPFGFKLAATQNGNHTYVESVENDSKNDDKSNLKDCILYKIGDTVVYNTKYDNVVALMVNIELPVTLQFVKPVTILDHLVFVFICGLFCLNLV